MKNYVVWTNCQINDTNRKFGIESCADPVKRNAYDQMFQISRATAKKFLAGEWEEVVFTDPAETRVHMFQQNWQRIWDLWHQEPCNILYLDSDAMFIRPTEMFGRFEQFRLFNWTDPKRKPQFVNYYNAGVRYYPSTMSADTWKIGQDMAQNWNLDIWDQEQIIFNAMFWSQNITDYHHPELNWQMLQPNVQVKDRLNAWNTVSIENSHIVHVHGSRGALKVADTMKNLATQVGIISI